MHCRQCGTEQKPRASPASEHSADAKVPEKRTGCLLSSCRVVLGASLVLALLAAVGALLFTNLAERVGLRQPVAERLLSGPADHEAARSMMADLAAAGVITDGISIFVLPIKGESYQVAYAVLDSAEGFRFSSSAGDDPVLGSMIRLATGGTASEYGIERVAIDYRDDLGESKLVMTAPVATLRGFAEGTVTREKLLEAIDARASLPSIYEEFLP